MYEPAKYRDRSHNAVFGTLPYEKAYEDAYRTKSDQDPISIELTVAQWQKLQVDASDKAHAAIAMNDMDEVEFYENVFVIIDDELTRHGWLG